MVFIKCGCLEVYQSNYIILFCFAISYSNACFLNNSILEDKSPKHSKSLLYEEVVYSRYACIVVVPATCSTWPDYRSVAYWKLVWKKTSNLPRNIWNIFFFWFESCFMNMFWRLLWKQASLWKILTRKKEENNFKL